MKKNLIFSILLCCIGAAAYGQSTPERASGRISTATGLVEGVTEISGIRSFKGIPFAAPPVGPLRWKEPQPVQNWTGVKKADHFGNRGMQKPIYGDMGFRADSSSEDCLYLNVWAPQSTGKKLPVLVYFYGGGLMAGDGSEPRYDGESMAKNGIVVLTVNYRLGIFGFMAHPELSKESEQNASGNYGLLDQNAALRWVKQNIAAFGGDPERITIAGESAGSISVFAQMASPLSKGLIAGAIGESGAMIRPTLAPVSLSEGENRGLAFGKKVGALSLEELRKIPAEQLLDLAFKNDMVSVPATVDGYFLPELPVKIFAGGKQAHVPLLVGWNSAEVSFPALLKSAAPTPENYAKVIGELYPGKAETVLKLYPGTNDAEVMESATALASDRFIVYSTWKWADLHSQTGNKPVYRYIFSKSKPAMTASMKGAVPGLAGGITKGAASGAKPVSTPGAPHAFEIEYALGNLDYNKVYAWTAEDRKVSETMLGYFASFIKTGNPNTAKLPAWPELNAKGKVKYIDINTDTKPLIETNGERYRFLDQEYK